MKHILLVFCFLLVGCNQASGLTPTQPTETIPILFPTQEITLPPLASTPVKTATVATSAKSSSTTSKTPTPPQSLLRVTFPKDESIVNVSKLVVVGQTLADAVVSVDGNLATIDPVGKFQFAIMLEEGPNIIEIVASDKNGNEQAMILRVIYEP